MRILLLTDDLFPGGIERHVTDLANGLVGHGHAVTVAATSGPFVARLRREVRFIDLPLARDGHRGPLKALRAAAILRAILRNDGYHIVHTHMRYSDVFGRLGAVLHGAAHVSTCHTSFDDRRWGTIFGQHTIAASHAVKGLLVDVFGKRPESITVIHNDCLPVKRLPERQRAKLKRELGLQRGRVGLFNISRFSPDKDVRTTVKALGALRSGGVNNFKCFLIGYGEQQRSILEMIAAHDLEDSVVVLPGTTDVGPILNVGDFGILSSRREGGIPYVLMEAASLGKPMIASATGGASEFIQDGQNGILFPGGDVNALADRIHQLIRDRRLVARLGRKAQAKYRSAHASGKSVEQILAVYDELLKERAQ